jgi:ribosomal protein S18 acetylase RimI-like enzyme
MPEIEIRPAFEEEIQGLVEIDHAYKSQYVWQMDRSQDEGQMIINFREIRLPRPMTVEYPRSARHLLRDWMDYSALLVGVLAGTAVGYICISENISPTTAWVTDLVVAPSARRKGIASALVLAAEDWAKKRNNRRMILEMQSKNTPAIRLALKIGFEFCGYNDHYYSNQDIALFFAQFLRSSV